MKASTMSREEFVSSTQTRVVESDRPMITLGLGLGLTFLIAAVLALTGGIFWTFGIISSALPLFAVAFASAPLFNRLRIRWSVRASVLGAALGWAFSAPLSALISTAINSADNGNSPFEFVPETWLWALVPLSAVLVLAWIRQRVILCTSL